MMELTIWDLGALAAKLAAYLGCFLAMGSTLYGLATPGLDAPMKKRLARLVVSTVIIAVLASLAQIAVQSGRLLDEGFAGMVDPKMLTLVREGPLGTSVALRLLGLGLLFLSALQIPLTWLIGAVGAVITASSFSFVGHGTGDPRLVLATLVTLHLLGISFWIGALWPLRTVAANGQKNGDDLPTTRVLAHRFGMQAAWVVGGLVLAGLVLAILILGSPLALFTSQYGLTLVAKLAGVGLLLGLAAANKLRFVPAIQRGDASAAGHLRTSILWEMFVVLLILVVTAVLTTITPLPETMEMTNGS